MVDNVKPPTISQLICLSEKQRLANEIQLIADVKNYKNESRPWTLPCKFADGKKKMNAKCLEFVNIGQEKTSTVVSSLSTIKSSCC